jgi:endoglucanase
MRIAAMAAAAAIAGPFYANPDSNAERQARVWEEDGRTANAQLMQKLGDVPQAFWLTSGSSREVRRDVDGIVDAAARSDAVAVLVAYNAPNRDCGGYSKGGSRHYRRWIDGFARGIRRRRAVVIVEPDAVASNCVNRRHVHDAVMRLTKLKRAAVYIDAGRSLWQPARTMARRLKQTAIAKADGFALNVSNFRATDELVAYGTKLSGALNGAHFVIDTSRNGLGPAPDARWCNPPGRGLGARPTSQTGIPLVDAFLWIKIPGESDGECDGAPEAGRWWPEYALGLTHRANPAL